MREGGYPPPERILLNGRWVTRLHWNNAQRAFPVRPFQVLCPYCSAETRLPSQPKLIDQRGDWLFRCKECNLMFVYNPFIDKSREERKVTPPESQERKINLKEIVRLIHDSEGDGTL